jgi:hypothetical protein
MAGSHAVATAVSEMAVVTGLEGWLDREVAAGENFWATEVVSFLRGECELGVTRRRFLFGCCHWP